jgi:uncharacterized membrane protein YciS (DUF1049 family)
MSWITTIVPAILALVLFVYIWLFIFIHGSAPTKDKTYTDFVFALSTAKMSDFVGTLFTYGYLKASFLRFIVFYKQLLFKRVAKKGSKAPDAKVTTLQGEQKALLADCVGKFGDLPVVINFGSYT